MSMTDPAGAFLPSMLQQLSNPYAGMGPNPEWGTPSVGTPAGGAGAAGAGSGSSGGTSSSGGGIPNTPMGGGSDPGATLQPQGTGGSTTTLAGSEPLLQFSPPPGGGSPSTATASPPASSPASQASGSGSAVHYAGLSSNPIPGAGGPIMFASGGGVPNDPDNDGDDDSSASGDTDNDQGGGDPLSAALNRALGTIGQLLTQGRKRAGIQNHGGDDQQDQMGPTWGQMPNPSGIPDAPQGGMQPAGSPKPGELNPTPLVDDESDKGYSNPTMTGRPAAPIQDAARGGSIENVSGSSRIAGIARGGGVPEFAAGGDMPDLSPDAPDVGQTATPPADQPASTQGGIPPGPTPSEGLPGEFGEMERNQTQAPSQVKQNLMDYLAGKGAAPSEMMKQLADRVDPRRQLPDAVRHPLVIQAATDMGGFAGGYAATQYMRQNTVGLNATAAAALAKGDIAGAARIATEASGYHMDGQPVTFTPARDHIIAQVGKENIPLAPDQFKQYLMQGPLTTDAANEVGIGQYLKGLTQGKKPAAQPVTAAVTPQQPQQPSLGAAPGGGAGTPAVSGTPAAPKEAQPDWANYAGPLVEIPGVGKVYKNLWDVAGGEHSWASQQPARFQRYQELVQNMHNQQTDKSGRAARSLEDQIALQQEKNKPAMAHYGPGGAFEQRTHATEQWRQQQIQNAMTVALMRQHNMSEAEAGKNARAILANPASNPELAKHATDVANRQMDEQLGPGSADAHQRALAPNGALKATEQYRPYSVQESKVLTAEQAKALGLPAKPTTLVKGANGQWTPQ
jgi:hypothetical protein